MFLLYIVILNNMNKTYSWIKSLPQILVHFLTSNFSNFNNDLSLRKTTSKIYIVMDGDHGHN